MPSTQPVPSQSRPEIVEALTSLRPGLCDQPLPNAHCTLFVDGSSVVDSQGCRRAAYAVVTLTDTVEAAPLPAGTTSQKAEFIALTRALQLSKGLRITIYTDSKSAFLIAHTHSALWWERSFLTTKGTPVVNGPPIAKLLEPLQLPSEVAIVHCRGHQHSTDPVARGNAQADSVAHGLTTSPTGAPVLFLSSSYRPEYHTEENLSLLKREGQESPQGWIFLGDRLALPKSLAPTMVSDIHRSLHIGPKTLFNFLESLFDTQGLRDHIQKAHSCKICARVTPPRWPPPPLATPPTAWPPTRRRRAG